MRWFLILAVAPFFLHAKDAASDFKCPDYKISKIKNENKKLDVFLNASWMDGLKDAPEFAYDLGDKEAGSRWSDESLENVLRLHKKTQCLQTALGKIKRAKLNAENRLNYDLFKYRVDMQVQGQRFQSYYLALNQLGGIHTSTSENLRRMPQNNRAAVENILKRLEKIPQKVAEHKLLLMQGLQKGVTTPQVVMKAVPAQFDPFLQEDVTKSPLYVAFLDLKNFDEKTKSEFQEKAQKVLKNEIQPALKDFKKFLVEEYIPKSRTTISVQDLPDGKEWYSWSVKRMTTTDLDPESIHEMGLKEVARLNDEMEKVRIQAGFKKDLKAFKKFLLTDSQFFFNDPEDLMKGFRDIAKRADYVLPKLFKVLPRTPYGINAIPDFKAPSSPTAYYMSGSLAAGRAGSFEANTYNLKSRPKWGMEALTLHEAMPGHHLQIALARENETVPSFRKYGGYPAYGEGWGLYAEGLGYEMGFYQDVYSKYGQLAYEMWRSVRLVIDTGIHGKNWTREQSVAYFLENISQTRLEAEVEVDRYIVWPGQALSYKLGQLKISELRKSAETELKDSFDIRDFHDVVLNAGSIPLTVLESRVNEWIQNVQKSKASSMH